MANNTNFSKEQYLSWYKSMYLMRKFEEKLSQLYIQRKFGGFLHLYIGQEAVVAGAVSATKPEDNMIRVQWLIAAHAQECGARTETGIGPVHQSWPNWKTHLVPSPVIVLESESKSSHLTGAALEFCPAYLA